MSLSKEKQITLRDAAKITPKPIHPSAPWRWMRRGVLARNGERIYLEGIRVGGKLFTSEEAMQRFFVAVTEADDEHFRESHSSPSASCTPSESRRAYLLGDARAS